MRLFKLGRPEYPLLGAGMCALAVTSVSSISAPYFFGKVIDAATKNSMHELNQHVYICECASWLARGSSISRVYPCLDVHRRSRVCGSNRATRVLILCTVVWARSVIGPVAVGCI